MGIWVAFTFWLVWAVLPRMCTGLCVDMCFHFSWVYDYLWTLGYMITLCPILWEIAELFSTVATSFYIPTSGVWGAWFQHILTKKLVLSTLYCPAVVQSPSCVGLLLPHQARILGWLAVSYSRGSSWPRDQTHVPRRLHLLPWQADSLQSRHLGGLCKCPDGALLSFWFAFLWWLMMLSIFSWAYRSFVYILWRNVCLAPLPIQKNGLVIALLLSCNHLLYTLEPSPLSDKWFADVFFPFMSICWWYPLIKKAF